MLSIDKSYKTEYVINKSKFLSFAYPVFDEDMVKNILDGLKTQYNDATHICYAYILNEPSREKSSDDGEPTGTAGKPMLELLKKKKLSNILIVVIRYFGGIKLGAGGLVRAYTTASNMVLSDAEFCEYKLVDKYKLSILLSEANVVIGYLKKNNFEVVNQKYLDRVYLEVLGDISGIAKIYPDVSVEKIGSEMVCHKLQN